MNGESSPIEYNYPVGNNNSWYVAIAVTPGSVYTWSATIETCGGGQTIEGEYTSPISGCTDSLALNYDSTATNDDGSCNYPVYGCTDSLAVNYNAQATDNDGSCEYPLGGCIDESACNYDSSANTDDGTCEYAVEGYDCEGNEVCNYASVDYLEITGSNESNGVYYLDFESYSPVGTSTDGYTAHIVVNGESSPIEYNYPVGNNNSWYVAIAVTPGSVYTWSATIETCGGGQTIEGEYTSPISGCTDSLALNYDSTATNDDGSCNYPVYGCTDSLAVNYNAQATDNDGSCEYPLGGCIDESACNYDSSANTDDGTCEYAVEGYDCEGNEVCNYASVDYLGITGSNESNGVYYLDFESYSPVGTSTDGYTAHIVVNGESSPIEYNYPVGNNNSWYVAIAVTPGSVYTWSATIETCGGGQTIEGEYTSPVLGCIDQNALNYNESATYDDGSCNYPVCQNIDLSDGWSLFSTYIIPQIDSLDELLLPIVDNIEIVKDFEGAAYIPDYNFNGIGTISIGQGYQSKLYTSSSIDVCGEYASPELTPISLTEGWNMIGYLRLDPAPADLVLGEIAVNGNLIIAKDYLGLAYLPDWNFNAIGNMKATQGYQIKVSQDDILLYLSNENSYRMSSAIKVIENNTSHFSKVTATDNNMTIVIEDAAWNVVPNEGAEIAAFDKFGNIVGSAIYSSPVSVLTVWGDDETTTSKDGMLISELVSFKLWNNNEVKDLTVLNWIEGSSSYQVNGISVASTIETNNMITDLNTSERVLVKVVNVLGQEVNLDDQTFKGTVLFNVFDDGTVEQIIR